MKFQIISIVAVFAAVGVGLAVGTAARNSPAAASTKDELSALSDQNDDLQAQIDYLDRDEATREKFVEELVPTVLAGRLKATKVVLLVTPSGVDSVADLRKMLMIAGANLTGALQITGKFTDPRYDDELLDLAHTVLPSSVGGAKAAGVDGVAASASVLATVLLKGPPAPSSPSATSSTEQDLRKVLASYASQGYLLGTDGVNTPADVVVVVSGPPMADEDAARRNAAMLGIVTQFDQAGHIVVAANTDTGAGNLVAQIRHDGQLSKTVSTVDNVTTPQGRLVAAWAAADQIAGKTGHFGVGEGTTLLPKITG